jgi:predicted acylesterase/phospholipase RssA
MEDWDPTQLVISGGNVSLATLVGSVLALEKKGILKEIKQYSASGNGCVISVLLCLGYSPLDIQELLSKQKESLFFDSRSSGDGDNRNQGTQQFVELRCFFSNIFIEKLTVLPTFHQLYLNTAKKLHLTAYNLSTRQLCYFSTDKTPDMSVLTAIILTLGVYSFDSNLSYEGDLYIDAATSNPTPVSCFKNRNRVLAIRACWNRSLEDIYPGVLLDVACEELNKLAFRSCTSKTIFITLSISGSSTSYARVLECGYDQTMLCLEQILTSKKSKVFWDSRIK